MPPDLDVGGGAAHVHHPGPGQHQEHPGTDEGGDRRVAGDLAHGAERVGVEQQAAQGVAHEERLAQLAELGELVGVGVLVLRHADVLARHVLVGAVAAGGVHVHEDVVVGVRLGLVAGEHLLAGVLVEGRVLVGGLEGVLLGHRDRLDGELVVHLVGDVDVRPGEESAGSQEHDGNDETGTGEQVVEGLPSHDL